MFKCVICGEEFDELLRHLHKEKQEDNTVFLGRNNVKKDHLEKYDKIKKSCYEAVGSYLSSAEETCFCGGEIEIHYYYDAEVGAGAEAECKRCKTLWYQID